MRYRCHIGTDGKTGNVFAGVIKRTAILRLIIVSGIPVDRRQHVTAIESIVTYVRHRGRYIDGIEVRTTTKGISTQGSYSFRETDSLYLRPKICPRLLIGRDFRHWSVSRNCQRAPHRRITPCQVIAA